MEILDRDYIEYEEFLEHHGVDGQKWGVTHGPPYPLDKNAARQARKKEKAEKRKQRERFKRLKKARKVRAKNQAAKKKAVEKEAKEQEKLQKKKDKVLKRGTPSKVFKNRNLFTKDDLNSTFDRFDWEQKLDNYSVTRLENMSKKAQSLTKLFASGMLGYNNLAAIYNAWFPDEKPLPRIEIAQPKEGKKK